MLMVPGVVAPRCMGLLARTPTLLRRRRAMPDGRCCFLLRDLPVLPPRTAAPSPMNGLHTDSHANGNAAAAAHSDASPSPTDTPAGAPAPLPDLAGRLQPKDVDEWLNEAGRSGTLEYGSSEEDCNKEKFDERTSLSSGSDSGFRTPLCRICFQGPEQAELLSPCRCSGSVRCTHEPCLIKWISERGSWSCELCYYKYHVIAISTKNPLQWQAISLTVIEKVQIAAAVLGTLFLVASISWLAWSSMSPHARWQRQDLLFQICYAMYGFMDLVCIALIIHEGPSVFRIFHRWQAVNQQWKVLNYDKARDLEEQQKPGPPGPMPPVPLPAANPRNGALSGAGGGGAEPPASSPSSSSLLAAVAAATPGLTVTAVMAAGLTTVATQDSVVSSSATSDNGTPLSPSATDHRSYRWTYSLLHLLGQLRQDHHVHPNPPILIQVHAQSPGQHQPRDSSRELVMRVTTV
ncbi:E3 ubiquitin-protein ligase MARCHF4 [Aplochiton taeniatus]